MAVRGEEAVVAKEAVVTGEVVVEKEVTAEQQQVRDTVRRTEVDFDENYHAGPHRLRAGLHHAHLGEDRRSGRGRTFESAEPNYRAGYTAGTDERYTDRQFEDVEPELRRDYESGTWGTSGTTTQATGNTSGDSWEHLREEVRHGFQTARNRTS